MWPYLKSFFADEATFRTALSSGALYIRGALAAVALAVSSGQINLGKYGEWIGPAAILAALLIRGGDKNVNVMDQVKALTPAERTALLAQLQSP